MKIVAVIPARLGSTRLPRKMLREIGGVPLIGRVYQAVRASSMLADVVVATDSEEIFEVCKRGGWNPQITAQTHRSGTERVHEVAQNVDADVYINVQGDEPMARPEQIAVLAELMNNPEVQVGTLKTRAAGADIDNPNAGKVVTDKNGRALYFSRTPIPHARDGGGANRFKHLGFYAYRKSALEQFVSLPESSLERSERLEQLRFLENGIPIYVAETPFDSIGVDTEEDLRRVEEELRKRS